MDDDGGSTDAGPPLLLSERCASSLIHKLISLGYFHASVHHVEPPPDEPREYTIESTRAAKLALSERKRYDTSDDECNLLVRKDGSGCITLTALVAEVADVVRCIGEGRASIEAVATDLGLDEADEIRYVERAADELCRRASAGAGEQQHDGSSRIDFLRLGREIISEEHLDALATEVDAMLELNGRVVVSDIARTLYRTPADVCLRSLTDRMKGGSKSKDPIIRSEGARLTTGGGGSGGGAMKQIVTARYDDERAAELKGMLRGKTEPTSLDSLIETLGWDDATAVGRVHAMCSEGTLLGEVHGGGGGGGGMGAGGALYVPNVYTTNQRRGVDDFFMVNGYITSEMCLSMGILPSQMGDYVKESFPDAIHLSKAVINPDVIISPLEAVIQESILSNSFVDLRTTLPEALVASEDDVRQILQDLVLPNLRESNGDNKQGDALDLGGVSVIADCEALYCSRGMITNIEAKLLPSLIEAYGKSRAEEIERSKSATASGSKKKRSSSNADVGEIIMTGAKLKKSGKRVERKGKKDQDDGGADDDRNPHESSKKVSAKDKRRGRWAVAASNSCFTEPSAGTVPLVLVAKRVAEEYPDLLDVQENYGPLFEPGDVDAPKWESANKEGDEEDSEVDGGGPLYSLCLLALFTSAFRDACARAVKAELDKIASTKHGISVGGRKVGAAKVRSIEGSFEDAACFPAACHLVQMLAKLPQSLCNSGDVDAAIVARLERDFLTGCAADFTRRITEYCLFKEQVEDDIFVFEGQLGSSCPSALGYAESDLPSFCHPVNTATPSFGHSYMFCKPDGEGKPRDPLPTLREVLPGNTGIGLARMWATCGGECYEGGKKLADDGSEYVRPGNIADFLRHAEESCLNVCGLPFKILDKKADKKAMFARRQQLSQLLESSPNGRDVLDYSIMLLFQQLKSTAVAGDELASSVLHLLTKEKKFPQPVASKFKELADSLGGNEGDAASEDLISIVKECGLSRDISKHTF